MPDEEEEGPKLSERPGLFLALGVVGLLGFLVALGRLVYLDRDLGVAACAGCGALLMYGFSEAYELRKAQQRRGPRPPRLTGRARELGIAPSFEVYDPRGRSDPADDRFGPGR